MKFSTIRNISANSTLLRRLPLIVLFELILLCLLLPIPLEPSDNTSGAFVHKDAVEIIPTPTIPKLDNKVAEIYEAVNEQRQSSSIEPLNYNEKLANAAQAKAEDMIEKAYWPHTSVDGREPWDFIKQSGYFYAVAGENLAKDFSSTSDMVQAWIESPTHRANILEDGYQDTGIAVLRGSLGGRETVLVVQMFGKL